MNKAHTSNGTFAKRDPEVEHEITKLAVGWYNSLKVEHEIADKLDYIHDSPLQIAELHSRIAKTLQYERRLLSKLRDLSNG